MWSESAGYHYVQSFLKHVKHLASYVYNYLIQNTFGVKKAQPSKVESYLEVNT